MSKAGKIQSIPTTSVTGYWDEGSDNEFPEQVRIVMSNGKRVWYQLPVEQPHPAFRKVIDLLDNMPVYGGYKYKK